MTTMDTRLFALDARTGSPCKYFGDNGVVDMKRGMGEFEPGMYAFTSAPAVALDTIHPWVIPQRQYQRAGTFGRDPCHGCRYRRAALGV